MSFIGTSVRPSKQFGRSFGEACRTPESSKNGNFRWFHVIFLKYLQDWNAISSISIWFQLENIKSMWYLISKWVLFSVPDFWEKVANIFTYFQLFCGHRFGRNFGRSFGGSGRSFGFGRISFQGVSVVRYVALNFSSFPHCALRL